MPSFLGGQEVGGFPSYLVAKKRVFPLLLSLLVDLPVLLPELPDLILDPRGCNHPSLRTLRLAVRKLLGGLSRQQAFLAKLHVRSAMPRGNLREICITLSGKWRKFSRWSEGGGISPLQVF